MEPRPFGDLAVKSLPQHFVDPKSQQRFRKLADELDSIGRIEDSTGEVYIHKERFRELLREFVPSEFAERCLASLAASPDNRFLPETNPGTAAKWVRPLGWEGLRQHTGRVVPEAARREFYGDDGVPIHDAVLKALQGYWPNLPGDVLEPVNFREQVFLRLSAADDLSESMGSSGTLRISAGGDFWSCLVDHLGFWGAVAAIIFIIVVGMSLDAAIIAAGGVIGGSAFWDAFWTAFATYGIEGAVFEVIVSIIACLLGFEPPF
jgi:hypothetical protein